MVAALKNKISKTKPYSVSFMDKGKKVTYVLGPADCISVLCYDFTFNNKALANLTDLGMGDMKGRIRRRLISHPGSVAKGAHLEEALLMRQEVIQKCKHLFHLQSSTDLNH